MQRAGSPAEAERIMGAFSILGRIGGDATRTPASRPPRRHLLSVSSVGSEAMQPGRPRTTDRRRWRLSVSSVGSEAMQRMMRSEPSPTRGTAFSILGRIGGDATESRRMDHDPVCLFQYPRSDRRRCNKEEKMLSKSKRYLSVSSVGSEAMQPTRRSQQAAGRSFLSVSSVGSEAMQPTQWYLPRAGYSPFQYPRSDRRRCNADCPQSWDCGHVTFQYPRSDRRRCNALRRRGRVALRRTFSILGRIGGDATGITITTRPITSSPFQYPRSDRRRCNPAGDGALRV